MMYRLETLQLVFPADVADKIDDYACDIERHEWYKKFFTKQFKDELTSQVYAFTARNFSTRYVSVSMIQNATDLVLMSFLNGMASY